MKNTYNLNKEFGKATHFSLLFTLLSLLLMSCSDWLDITQKGQIDAEELYADEVGYEESMAGIYQDMAKNYLYGRNMITVTDAMAQFWALPSGTEELAYFKKFDYTESNTEDIIDNIWGTGYNVIANANLLLGHIESDTNNEKGNYKLIRGEALGVRALVHLDLLRLFAPQSTTGNDKAIPYRTKYDNQTVGFMTVNEVLEAAEKDLLEARTLLAEDPIKVNGRKNSSLTNYNSKTAENYRGCRMNYYAVCGLLARLYTLKGDLDTAEQYAQEVIDASNIFWLISPNEVSGNPLFQQEILFSLYIGSNIQSGLMSAFGVSSTGGTDVLSTSDGMLSAIFVSGEGASDDYRRSYAWRNSSDGKTTTKYLWEFDDNNTTTSVSQLLQPVVPIIRLSEMYLIVAEAHAAKGDGVTVDTLNTLRKSRNLPSLLKTDYTQDELVELILAEARREFVAEGQMFYMYKRLNHSIMTESGEIATHNVQWTLPIPKVEQQYNK